MWCTAEIALHLAHPLDYAARMDRTGERTAVPTTDRTHDPTEVPTGAVTVAEAAEILGISTEAARMRVKRGTLNSTRIDGNVYVLLERPNPRPNGPNARPNDGPNPRPNGTTQRPNDRHGDDDGPGDGLGDDALVDALQDRIASLERQLEIRTEELRRRDHLLAAALERIPPQLEAPTSNRTDARDGHETDDQGDRVVQDQDGQSEDDTSLQRSWWRRLFGV